MARLKILIGGGGIAGNTLAFWLSKLGHDITLVERFPTLRAFGLQIDIRGPGIEVLKHMGLMQAFRAKSIPEQCVQVVDSSGRCRAYFPVNRSGQGRTSLISDFEIMRSDLCHLLHDATRDRAKYVFGTSIEGFEEKGGIVEVVFANGQKDSFDLVVGADGAGSRTRKQMLGSDTKDGFYTLDEVYAGYFTIPRPIQHGEGYLATAYMDPGSRAAC